MHIIVSNFLDYLFAEGGLKIKNMLTTTNLRPITFRLSYQHQVGRLILLFNPRERSNVVSSIEIRNESSFTFLLYFNSNSPMRTLAPFSVFHSSARENPIYILSPLNVTVQREVSDVSNALPTPFISTNTPDVVYVVPVQILTGDQVAQLLGELRASTSPINRT